MFILLLIVCAAAAVSMLVKYALRRHFYASYYSVAYSPFIGGEAHGRFFDPKWISSQSAANQHNKDASSAIASLTKKLALWAEKIVPADTSDINKIQSKLDKCGLQIDTTTWRGICILAAFVCAITFAYASICLSASAISVVASAAVGGVCGKLATEIFLAYKTKIYKQSVERDLPETLDIMAIAVASGLTLEDSFMEAAESLDAKCALAHEFARMNWEVNFCDISRVGALEGFMTRVESPIVSDFCTSTIQAIESGGSMSKNLAIQAQTARDIKFDNIREQIAKLDTKMTIPLGLFFMPATGILIMAPVIYNAATEGLKLLGQ
jgi:Flp pilus assembly protein TadB